MEHAIGNCLRVMLNMEPEQATVMIFPMSLDMRMTKIDQLAKLHILNEQQLALLAELKPLVRAMQYLRNTTLHGVVMSFGDADKTYFQLRSKNRNLKRSELLSCEALINYAAHVTLAFRYSLGEKDYPAHTYALPHRPAVPDFLPSDCRAFPKEDRLVRETTQTLES
jgi:hypothetical protein